MTVAASNEDKTNAFVATFFLETELEEQTSNDNEYPPPKFPFSTISNAQIKCVIAQLKPHKAPGPDGIPNVVYTQCAEILTPYLGPIYQATFRIGVYPPQGRSQQQL